MPLASKTPRSMRQVAMDYLACRDHSEFELLQKLRCKFPDSERSEIQAVLESLKSENLLSDARFAEALIRYRKSRGFGFLYIKQDLNNRHINEAIIQASLAETSDWGAVLDKLLQRKMSRQPAISSHDKHYQKLMRFLRSRGFRTQEIVERLRSALKQQL